MRIKGLIKILRNDKNKDKGFSLVEILVTLGIFGILMAIVTAIILINLKVARRVNARSYVREETSFMLNILKKDIRNADKICDTGSNTALIVVVADEGGTEHTYRWTQNGKRVQREEVTIDSNCSVTSSLDITYMTPGDVEFDTSDPLNFEVSCDADNCTVKIKVKAWTVGLPGESGKACSDTDQQCIAKEVAVSSRNFNF